MMEQVMNVATFWTWDSRHGSNLRVMRMMMIVVVVVVVQGVPFICSSTIWT
jgi:hypothetical protein